MVQENTRIKSRLQVYLMQKLHKVCTVINNHYYTNIDNNYVYIDLLAIV